MGAFVLSDNVKRCRSVCNSACTQNSDFVRRTLSFFQPRFQSLKKRSHDREFRVFENYLNSNISNIMSCMIANTYVAAEWLTQIDWSESSNHASTLALQFHPKWTLKCKYVHGSSVKYFFLIGKTLITFNPNSSLEQYCLNHKVATTVRLLLHQFLSLKVCTEQIPFLGQVPTIAMAIGSIRCTILLT